jgi:zeaxanthin glucosyltransferase
MNIAFAILPEKGHINPYIGPAQALAARGHAVTIAAPGDISAQVTAAGLHFVPDLIPATAGVRPTHGPELAALIADAPRLAEWIEQLLLTGIPEQVDLLRAFYRRHSVQVVAVDPLYYAAAIAAHAEGLPWASVSNSLNPVLPADVDSALLRTTAALAPRRDSIFAAYGLTPSFRSADVLSPYLTVAFAAEALCGAVEGVRLAGPSFPLLARGDEVEVRPLPAGRPVIYASFGSQLYHWPSLFATLREAARQMGITLVLSAGELAASMEETEWCHVYAYAPQLALLAKSSVFVTHGGANSFMEALAAGVPQLLSPMCNDQFHQAHFLQKSGAGVVAELRGMSVKDVALRLDYLLSSRAIRAATERLSRSYQGNGASRAAEWIEELGR